MSSLLQSIVNALQQILCARQSKNQGTQNAGAHNYTTSPAPYQPQTTPNSHGIHQPQSSPPAPSPLTHASDNKPHHPYRNGDLINHENEHYKQLRARANQEGDEMAKCFEESRRAYEAHNGALAKELSDKGHALQKEMINLNVQASDWIFKANNTNRRPGEVDLHGLYVSEAIVHTERAIQEAQSRGDSEIHLIVGKGLHSTEHVSKLKPAIEELMQRYNLAARLDVHNSGVLVVALDGQRNDRSLGLDDISRRLEKKDADCVIM